MAEVAAAKGNKTKEEIMIELEEKVIKYVKMYGTCSQTSFCALNEQFELKGENTAPSLMLFAGGIAGRRETCGAVVGSLLAIGFAFSPKDKKELMMQTPSIKFANQFFTNFEQEFGSTRCYQSNR